MAAQAHTAQQSAALLELRNIQKWFGGVHALRGIDLTLQPGEAYHLLGENGCGKSTVIKIMSGAHAPTSGEIVLNGETFASLTPIQALAAGIETVYQDLSLLPNLTVAENVALNEQLVNANGRLARLFDRRRLRETAERALAAAGLPTDRAFLNTIVSDLPLASRQLVAIAHFNPLLDPDKALRRVQLFNAGRLDQEHERTRRAVHDRNFLGTDFDIGIVDTKASHRGQ